jgi:uncharacterized protein involved in exopolysaccharide biosynthesis
MSRIDDALRRIAQIRRPGAVENYESGRAVAASGVTLDAYEGERPSPAAETAPRLAERVRALPRIVPPPERPTIVATSPAANRSETSADEGAPSTDDGALIDVRLILDYARFVLGSLRRHKLIAAATFVFVAGLSVTAALLWPPTYHADARLIVQRNDVMAALSNPGRAIPHDADAPTRGAAEAVLSRDNLLSIIKQTNLLAQWQQRRPPALRLKDAVMYRLHSVPSEAERMEALIGLLEQRLTVLPGMEGTLTIAVTWPDRQMAYEIVETAVQNFLDSKRVAESSAIGESVTILERYVAQKQTEVNNTFAELQTEIANRPRAAARRMAPMPRQGGATATAVATQAPAAAPVPPGTSSSFGIVAPEKAARLARVKVAIEGRRGDLNRLNEAKNRELTDLQARLSAALTVYTEDHPTVSSLRQNISSISADTPQMVSLRAEIQTLEHEQDQLLAEPEQPRTPAQPAGDTPKPGAPEPVAARPAVDPAPLPPAPELSSLGMGSDFTSPTSLRLRLELGQLGEMRDRLESARIELATSQAGFKFRYGVVRPTQMPRSPMKPNVLAIILAGIIAALGLAVFAPVATDVIRGRVVEPWQVDRLVGVPVVLRLRTL